MKWLTIISILLLAIHTSSCRTTYPNQNVEGQVFPKVKGKSLAGKVWQLPDELAGKKAVLLIGYVRQSQFDIDRWLIGLDFYKVKTNIFEVPTINSFFAQMIQEKIDSGMRSGIPNELWKIVITVYDEAETIESFLGNTDPGNARVVVLDEKGQVTFIHDRGFSVPALKQLLERIKQ